MYNLFRLVPGAGRKEDGEGSTVGRSRARYYCVRYSTDGDGNACGFDWGHRASSHVKRTSKTGNGGRGG